MAALGAIGNISLLILAMALFATSVVSLIEFARYWLKKERRQIEIEFIRQVGLREALRKVLLEPVEPSATAREENSGDDRVAHAR